MVITQKQKKNSFLYFLGSKYRGQNEQSLIQSTESLLSQNKSDHKVVHINGWFSNFDSNVFSSWNISSAVVPGEVKIVI